MNISQEITLIAVTETQGHDNYILTSETKRTVFADVKSVKRAEFFAALQVGIKEVVSFALWQHDYNDEPFIESNGIRYKVERSYSKDGERIELNCSAVTK